MPPFEFFFGPMSEESKVFDVESRTATSLSEDRSAVGVLQGVRIIHTVAQSPVAPLSCKFGAILPSRASLDRSPVLRTSVDPGRARIVPDEIERKILVAFI